MSEKLSTQSAAAASGSLSFDRAAGARILARSFYKELRGSGYTPKQLLALSTELIELITQDLQRERAQEKGAA